LGAAISGDIENFIVASTPGGIEAQEARGQRQACATQALPKKGTTPRDPWEKLGFVFANDVDDLFVYVIFPKGWSLKPTDHSMWSELLDDRGRKRAGMFYKAAFYDRAAHIHLTQRFAIERFHEDGVCVTDCTAVLRNFGTFKDRDYGHQDRLAADAKAWLHQNYPDWENPAAYWD
jgi:hypothetical protein